MASRSTPFPIENIPFGVISTRENPTPRCATALHNDAVDLSALEKDGFFDSISGFDEGAIFSKCSEIFGLPGSPNWHVIPSVYNGRTSSLNVSTTLTRPHGVIKDEAGGLSFTPTKKLDFELEMGVFISHPLKPGQILDIQAVKDHIFGFVILNDWSARDIQGFEMAPLGPFHSKGFSTTISPWIITMDALESVQSPVMVHQDPAPLPHLAWKGNENEATFDIDLSARIIRGGNTYNVTSTNLNELYWTPYQQATHLTSAGEGLSTGDIFGTGTISSARTDSNGEKTGLACLVERSLPRTSLSALKENGIVFFEDGDELIMEGWCVNKTNGVRFGFGQCRGTVAPAVKLGH
ncbi:uncharacterized protein N7503_011499 [Penicillium pulvis]|uniref:uncharacterized protein n=1 Tax=Penicillium pulvis TaxID=1562058 RepID=UPI002546F97C|nr:uncharacterized protein N7503_011499 [Penicillium pulvis]KAJ5786287.1 hypothetical protein N7503_011499 [Penicillium pulvis]